MICLNFCVLKYLIIHPIPPNRVLEGQAEIDGLEFKSFCILFNFLMQKPVRKKSGFALESRVFAWFSSRDFSSKNAKSRDWKSQQVAVSAQHRPTI